MIPTAYLRLVKRTQFITMGDFSHVQQVAEVLQQWWETPIPGEPIYGPGDYDGEWRDVETVSE